jgi:hypothetical protein
MRALGRIGATALGVSLGALVLQSGAAVGDRLVHRDAVADVWRSPIGSSVYAPVPTRVEGDIVRTRVSHAPRAIWVVIRLRDLTTTSNGNFHRLSIKSDRRSRNVEIDAFPGHWDGRAVTTTPRGRVVGCAVTHRIDYVEHKVVVRVPRRCLGRHPAWVRVAVRTTVAGTNYSFADDARATGLGSRIVYGKRVYR